MPTTYISLVCLQKYLENYGCDPYIVGSKEDPRLSSGPEERTKGTLNSVTLFNSRCGKVLSGAGARALKKIKVVVSGDPTLLPGLWLSFLTKLCLKHPVFFLPTLSDFAVC